MNHEGQFEHRITENGERIGGGVLDDPFVRCTISAELSRWGAFKALFRPLQVEYVVNVWGTEAAYCVVFNGDYTPPEPREYTMSSVDNAADAS